MKIWDSVYISLILDNFFLLFQVWRTLPADFFFLQWQSCFLCILLLHGSQCLIFHGQGITLISKHSKNFCKNRTVLILFTCQWRFENKHTWYSVAKAHTMTSWRSRRDVFNDTKEKHRNKLIWSGLGPSAEIRAPKCKKPRCQNVIPKYLAVIKAPGFCKSV